MFTRTHMLSLSDSFKVSPTRSLSHTFTLSISPWCLLSLFLLLSRTLDSFGFRLLSERTARASKDLWWPLCVCVWVWVCTAMCVCEALFFHNFLLTSVVCVWLRKRERERAHVWVSEPPLAPFKDGTPWFCCHQLPLTSAVKVNLVLLNVPLASYLMIYIWPQILRLL